MKADHSEETYVETLFHYVLPFLKTVVEIKDFHPLRISHQTKSTLHYLYYQTKTEDLLHELVSSSVPTSTDIPCLLSWIHSQSHFFTQTPHNLTLIITYLEKSCRFISTLKTNILSERLLYDNLKVLIVGGGPAGLMSAITAYSQGKQKLVKLCVTLRCNCASA
jgi:hypothetical protein